MTRGVASTPDASARLRALLDCGDSLAALVAAIDDPSEDIVRHALRRLTRPELPADARSRLRSALAAAPPSLAPDYARVLAVCRDGRAVTEAIGRLAGHSYTTRLAAARALAVLADARAADALREAVDDEVAGVRGAALDALARLGRSDATAQACQRRLTDRHAMVRLAAVNAVAHTGTDVETALDPLAADPDELVRREVARHGGRLGTVAVAALLADRDAQVRATAVQTAGSTHSAAVRAALVSDPDPQVRRAAAFALAAAADRSSADALAMALSDHDALVRTAATRALTGLCGMRGAADRIRAELDADSAARRKAALYTLGRIGEQLDAAQAAALVRDRDHAVRAAFVHVARTVAPNPEQVLLELARDPHPLVSAAAEGELRASRNSPG